ncbi:uncharacterized protein LOC142548630 [Primulina tabacum]|uniref:uncharacterized protein LOC142548630 n=1 Tax=Primulina tabacum TaxID=48773 RepID=UPI003F59D4C0
MSSFSLTAGASVLEESSQVSAPEDNRFTLAVNNTSLNLLSTTCAVCQRILSSGNESSGIEALPGVCGDCRFFLEDIETNSPDVYRRRMPVTRRRNYGSSESIETLFSQQFSELNAMERQTHSVAVEHDNQSVNYYGTRRLVQRASSHTTPSGSRRWRRVFSDTESDGFDSIYGESESNASLMRYRVFHGEGDTLSSSAYGGDSDVSADGQSFLEIGNFGYADGGGGLDSDTDIDPMNAGVYQWSSEDQGVEDEEEDDNGSEWEEANVEENMVESLRTGDHHHGPLGFNRNNLYMAWSRQSRSPRVDGTISLGARNRTRSGYTELLSNFDELETQNYAGVFGDYMDVREFEYSLEHLAETDISMMGVPPAAVSFVNSLPEIRIDGQYENLDNLSCAICKECPSVGTVLNQLPCLHLYHPSCILPWLSTRNTCPLCRYELPTDDIDYEERKRNRGNEVEILSMHLNDDGSSNDVDNAVADELSQFHHGEGAQVEPLNANSDTENCGWKIPRNRWFFAAAVAPIVSMIGISLMLWLGKPSVDGVCSGGHIPCRKENGQRRWWSFV